MSALEKYYATEYHRRNMQVASVIGAKAAVDQALERALSVKHIPNWLIAYLESAANRLPGLEADLAKWRDLAPDAPDAARQRAVIDPAQIRAEALREALEALRGAVLFGRTPQEQHAALEQYCLCRDAILAIIDKGAAS